MEQEDKDLLLKDLCGRLPYEAKIEVTYSKDSGSSLRARLCSEGINILDTNILGLFQQSEVYIKPYLFPMSSMTGEQRKELRRVGGYEAKEEDCGYHSETFYYNLVGHENVFYPDGNDIDWLDKNNFDYRGLIPMGLAIDATNKNIY